MNRIYFAFLLILPLEAHSKYIDLATDENELRKELLKGSNPVITINPLYEELSSPEQPKVDHIRPTNRVNETTEEQEIEWEDDFVIIYDPTLETEDLKLEDSKPEGSDVERKCRTEKRCSTVLSHTECTDTHPQQCPNFSEGSGTCSTVTKICKDYYVEVCNDYEICTE